MKSGKRQKLKFPNRQQWKQFFKVLNKKEKICFSIFLLLMVASGLFLGINFYFKNTKSVPAFGGIYKEGIIGQPRFINPLYLASQDVDRDLVELLFSGLMEYDNNGKLKKGLIKDYKVKESEKAFDITLKDKLLWQDGKPLTADDIIFTVNLIQNPQYQSPLRIKWLGITAQKISNNEVSFHLPKQYSGFLENLTLKIVPKHIFENIAPENLPWSLTSTKYLIGSGPFKLKKLVQDKSGFIKTAILERNKNYFGKQPFLKEIIFKFYQKEEDLLEAAKTNQIQGFALSDPKHLKELKAKEFLLHSLGLSRYFAVFFNLRGKNIFADKNLREALAFSINRDELIKNVFFGKAEKVDSPILPNFFGFNPPTKKYNFNIKTAREILDKEGFKLNLKTGKREKTVIKQTVSPFKRNLKYGSRGKDVEELQKCLAKDKAIYPEGIISEYFGKKTKQAVMRFQEKYASEILIPIGLKKGTGDVKSMTIKKLNQLCFKEPNKIIQLRFTLITVDSFPLAQIAENIKKNWETLGGEVDIKKVSLGKLQTEILAKRSFDVLLFGEALNSMADPFPFWHSSQKDYPGLNISGYYSKEADKLLEEARQTFNQEKKKADLEKFQNILINSIPAFFLARENYPYFISPKIKGYSIKKIIEPAKRFTDVENWFVKTRRIKK